MLDFLKELICNDVLICAVFGYAIAQFLKIFTYFWTENAWKFSRITASGGMPSSHSATVCALSVRTCMVFGPGSPLFAVTVIMAAIVMYDATGVRRAAGEQAKVLNRIITDLFSGDPAYSQKALKELIGHTPLQVIAGAILGILIGLFFPSFAPLFA